MKLSQVVAALFGSSTAVLNPTINLVINNNSGTTFTGFERNGVEVWLNVPYAQDTGGENRFKPPRPVVYEQDKAYDNTKEGPACPQFHGQWVPPLALANITETSEDCLNLNIVRPRGPLPRKLPVMLWIHGGSFWIGSNTETTHQPDSLVLKSVEDKHPVIHVAINYRLGHFGFAVSNALKEEGSLNAGLRDQRLAIEWVRDNIGAWGGDPNRITIFGQSSGGLACGMQLLAYGGTKPLPYQQGICESQSLEPGITGNFSINAMRAVVDYTGCNQTDLHSPETVACLRDLSTESLFNASFNTYVADIYHNIGDVWLPAVDGDFLPAPPSQLIKEGRFGKASYMMGWTEDDVTFFTDFNINTPKDTFDFIQGYLPAMPATIVNELLDLYPVTEFEPPQGTNLTSEFYRTARVFRDILMVCEPLYLAEGIRKKYTDADVYLYDWNQTILEPMLAQLYNVSHMGVVHTSEFAYIYGNFSHWNASGYPFNPTPEDYTLQDRSSHTWSYFASKGNLKGYPDTSSNILQGWRDAFNTSAIDPEKNATRLYVIGGPHEGLSTLDGPQSFKEIEDQKLRERCAFINSDRIIKYIQF